MSTTAAKRLGEQRKEKLWALGLPIGVFIVFGVVWQLGAIRSESLLIPTTCPWLFDIGRDRCAIRASHGSRQVAGEHRRTLHTYALGDADCAAHPAHHDGARVGVGLKGRNRSAVYIHLHHDKHARGGPKCRQFFD